MSKILIIDTCADCPDATYVEVMKPDSDGHAVYRNLMRVTQCMNVGPHQREIVDQDSPPPDWCPLPDMDEEKKMNVYHVSGTFIATARHNCSDCNGHIRRFIVCEIVTALTKENAAIIAACAAIKHTVPSWEYAGQWEHTEWTVQNISEPLPADQVMRYLHAPELPLEDV